MSPGTTTKAKHSKAQRGKRSVHSFDVQRRCFPSIGGDGETPEVMLFVSAGSGNVERVTSGPDNRDEAVALGYRTVFKLNTRHSVNLNVFSQERVSTAFC